MPDLLGTTLGKYRLVARLGQGGMAQVYKAYQPGLDRHVAIKIMHSALAAQPGAADRFMREAVAVARLHHPNIVQVYDFEVQAELCYMVMEFIEGPTLRAELVERRQQGQPFGLAEVLLLFSALAGAVDYAHARGVIHHDLKPDNVMITPLGQVVLTDFGVAQMITAAYQTATETIRGTPLYMAPEQAEGERGDKHSDIYSLGVILYELVTGRVPFEASTPVRVMLQHLNEPPPPPRTLNPTVPPTVEQVILKALAKNPAARYQTAGEMVQALWAALNYSGGQPAGPLFSALAGAPRWQEISFTPDRPPLALSGPPPPCPYRGLFAFQETDAPFFFGREEFVVRLWEAIQQQPLVAVLGPSGSGKSSVIMAGLIPRLRQEPAPNGWLIASFRPGRQPGQNLATALLPLLHPALPEAEYRPEANRLAATLTGREAGLARLIEQIVDRPHSQRRLLLVVDQFEELYTLCPEPETRGRFIDELLGAIDPGRAYQTGPAPALTVLLTLRADFLGQALTHRGLADALQAADIKLGPMTRQELDRAIENPAGRQGVLFETGLAARILDDVGDEPGNLPLLEFALTLLWERQVGGLLTHAAYEATGRVEGALAHYADEIYTGLNPADQSQAHHLFIQLVRPGEGTEDTRRLAGRAELGQANWALAQQLAGARLVVTGRDSTGQETVEVVHEALIRGWTQLRDWLNADRAFRVWQERLRVAQRQWLASRRDEGALLRGAVLTEAESWLAGRENDLSQTERTFIQAGVALRQQQQALQERQRRRLIAGLAAGLALTLLGLVIMLGLAITAGLGWQRAGAEAARAEAQRQEAERQQQIAEAQRREAETQRQTAELQRQAAEAQRQTALARQLEAQALNLATTQPDLALLLSLEAGQTEGPTSLEARRSLFTTLAANPHLLTYHRGHGLAVNNLAFSPNGRLLASAGSDAIIILWEAATGEPLDPPLSGHTGSINSLAFSPDGALLASAGADGLVRLWSLKTRQPVGAPLAGQTEWLNSVAFSPDGQQLASAGEDGSIRLWHVATRRPVGRLTGHTGEIHEVVFSPDGQWLASAGADETIRLWNLETRQTQAELLNGHTDQIISLAFSPGGELLASGSVDGTIVLWDLTGPPYPQLDGPLAGHTNTVLSLAFSPDGTILASSSWDKTIILWDVATRQALGPALTGHSGGVNSLAFSPNGQRLAAGGADAAISLWQLNPRPRLAEPLAEQPAAILSLAFSPDGRMLASGGDDNTITLWNALTEKPLGPALTGHTDWVRSLAFSPDGQILASGSDDQTVILWNVARQQPLRQLTGHTGWVRSVVFSPDGKFLASAGDDKTIMLWQAATGQRLRQFPAEHTAWISSLAFSPNNGLLASAGADGVILLWQVPSGRLWGQPLTAHTNDVYSLAFSPDGRLLASTSADTTVRLWQVETGQPWGQPLSGHASWISSVAFSPDGATLASAGADNRLILWDVATRQALGPPLTGHTADVQSLAFSPDGQSLVSGDKDGLILRWMVSPASWPGRACQVAARNLRWSEWQQYLPGQPYRPTCPETPLYLAELGRQAETYAMAGQPDRARAAFEQAVQAIQPAGAGVLNNDLCWHGSLAGSAKVVLPACERAVALASPDRIGLYRDSRGLARALSGDTDGAIEDFEFFITWSRQEEAYELLRLKRETWLAALKEGHNPFDQATLEALRNE